MGDELELYKKYHLDRDDERLGLFEALNSKFQIKKVLYPGSFVHITPAFVFPEVVFVDSYKAAKKFFDSKKLPKYIDKRKQYKEDSVIRFHLSDYEKDVGEKGRYFDLLISQYAGFISRACKKYLKKGGILVANNSHGDASMAHLDKDYRFIGVYNRRGTKYVLSEKNLNEYFIPKKKDLKVTVSLLKQLQRGIGYTKTPSGYIFRKVK